MPHTWWYAKFKGQRIKVPALNCSSSAPDDAAGPSLAAWAATLSCVLVAATSAEQPSAVLVQLLLLFDVGVVAVVPAGVERLEVPHVAAVAADQSQAARVRGTAVVDPAVGAVLDGDLSIISCSDPASAWEDEDGEDEGPFRAGIAAIKL